MDTKEFRTNFPDYKLPYYTHFDSRIALTSALRYVQKPVNIKQHAFYPFIEFSTQRYKYAYNEKHEKVRQLKIRKLHYAAHIDSFIYKYYSINLAKKYEAFLNDSCLSSCVLAYRADMHKKCNIHFAHQAFKFLRKQKQAYVIVGDFKDFFPSLEHKYLKQSLCNILGTASLPDDYYAIFKSLTKYAAIKRETLLKINKLANTAADLLHFNKLAQALPNSLTINQAKKIFPNFIEKNTSAYGIPQGTSLSGILANIYMAEFDKQIQKLAQQCHGLYMRYCDDIIIILPELNERKFKVYYQQLQNILKATPNIHLEDKKTNIFCYAQKQLINISNNCRTQPYQQISSINYLGFSFTNDGIVIRDKVVSKYYYRMYKKADTIARAKAKGNNHYSCKNLYLHYSDHHEKIPSAHSRIKYTANFLDYVKRAQAVFKEEETISTVAKKHLHKIRHRLEPKR